MLTYGYDLFASMSQTRRPENKEFLKYVSRSLRFRTINLHIKSKINKMKFMNSLKTEKRDRRQWKEASVCLLGTVGGGVGVGVSERWYKET